MSVSLALLVHFLKQGGKIRDDEQRSFITQEIHKIILSYDDKAQAETAVLEQAGYDADAEYGAEIASLEMEIVHDEQVCATLLKIREAVAPPIIQRSDGRSTPFAA